MEKDLKSTKSKTRNFTFLQQEDFKVAYFEKIIIYKNIWDVANIYEKRQLLAAQFKSSK